MVGGKPISKDAHGHGRSSQGLAFGALRIVEVKEAERLTKAHVGESGIDLVVEQSLGSSPNYGEAVYLSHYSDPGTNFFAVLLKFLYVTGRPIPEVKGPAPANHDAFWLDARKAGWNAAFEPFPLTYEYSYGIGGREHPTATASLVNLESGKPELEIRFDASKTILISQRAAKELVGNIPDLYPAYDSFRRAYEEFIEEAGKHPEQVLRQPKKMPGRRR